MSAAAGKDVVLPTEVAGNVARNQGDSTVGRQNTMIDVKAEVGGGTASKQAPPKQEAAVQEGSKVGGVASTVKGGSVIQGSGSSTGNGADETIR
jgi:hypothetical protein